MFPTLFSLNGIELHTWGLLVMLAFLGAAAVTSLRAPRVGIDPDKLVPMYLIAMGAGLVGARVLHFAMSTDVDVLREEGLLAFFDPAKGGFAFYGGAIGGIVAGGVYAMARQISPWKLFDIGAPSIMLGLAIGRLGCFSAGCCHGLAIAAKETGTLLPLPHGHIATLDGAPYLGLVFESGPGAGVAALTDIPVYPTQLMESGGAFLLFLVLSWIWKHHRRFDGVVMSAMLLLYAGLRATIEHFRGDDVRGLHTFGPVTLSTSQTVAAAMVLVSLIIVAIRLPQGRAPEQPLRPEAEDGDD